MLLSTSLLERKSHDFRTPHYIEVIDSLMESRPDWKLIDSKGHVDLIGCVVDSNGRDPGAVVQVRDVDSWTHSCSVTRECYVHL